MGLGTASEGKPVLQPSAKPLGVEDAAAMMLKAVHGHDAAGIATAMRMAHEAHMAEELGADEGEDYSGVPRRHAAGK